MTEIEKELERFIASGKATTKVNSGGFQTTHIDPLKIAKRFAQWQKEQMMKDAVEAVVSQVPCANEIIFRNPASVSYWYLPSEMNRLGINKGDKVKIIIVKE